ncbi:MAG: hypothetical protein PHF86_03195 [Candidatus Nanoarchaeia archaeon]|jgi:predicted protein tyrosine phosphatase|nr:hypothetical protein [Candidatus Nanoarchaeia archaeon]
MPILKISVLSRKQVEDSIFNFFRLSEKPWALISIWNVDELINYEVKQRLENLGCVSTLSVCFADLTLDEYKNIKNSGKLFSKEEAQKIISFVNKINSLEIPNLIIHCAAGISRSAAIGLWACRYLKLDEKDFRKENPQILPNFYILDVLNTESMIKKDYMKFWASKEMKNKRNNMIDFIKGGFS